MDRSCSKTRAEAFGTLSVALMLAMGCGSLTGIDTLVVDDAATQPPAAESSERVEGGSFCFNSAQACSTNRDCAYGSDRPERGGVADGGEVPTPAVCIASQCVCLLSEDCSTVTGDYLQDSAIVVASLLSTSGSQAAVNMSRQRAAVLAVREINAAGGIPAGDSAANGRPLVMVSCNTATNLRRVAKHVVHELHVPAIVGPNTSQDTIDLSVSETIGAGTLVLSPTALASGVADLADADLTWVLVPSDIQRAPLMMHEVGGLEARLREERGKSKLRLGIIYRDDIHGTSARTSLSTLTFNGADIADASNLGGYVQVSGYDYKQPDQDALVAKYAAFVPDIVVLAGTAEAITQIMLPLEEQWMSGKARPYYVLTDASRVPELLEVLANRADLHRRVRGIGVKSVRESQDVYNAFAVNYNATYGELPGYAGMGTAYDATYAIAFALAATHEYESGPSGASISTGLRYLSGGRTRIKVGSTGAIAAFRLLAKGNDIDAIGTLAPLDWDGFGAVSKGTLHVWCITGGAQPAFKDSGVSFDLHSQTIQEGGNECDR